MGVGTTAMGSGGVGERVRQHGQVGIYRQAAGQGSVDGTLLRRTTKAGFR